MKKRLIFNCFIYFFFAALPIRSYAEADLDKFFKSVVFNDVSTVSQLLNQGVDPNLIDRTGNTALLLALNEGSFQVARLLIESPKIDLEKPNLSNESPLMMAAFKGSLDLVKLLVDAHGVEINHAGWTALHYASTNGHTRIVEYLLDKGAYVDPESPNKTTALMMAARGGHIQIVKLLLDHKADISLVNGAGMTVIEFAEQSNQKEIAEGLKSRWKKIYGKPYPNK
jgi:ankyrin repeat protein